MNACWPALGIAALVGATAASSHAAPATTAVPELAHREPPDAEVWQPQAVRWPVAPEVVEPVAPWVPASAKEHLDAVEVTPARAAALWLPAAEVKRVRVVRGALADLRLSRVAGSAGARLAVDEPGLLAADGIELVEPVGPGSIWVIAATTPTTIVVERVADREPRLAWEILRDDLRAWIDHDGNRDAMPEVPADDGGAAQIRLRGARAAGAALGTTPAIVAAARAWRRMQVDTIIAMLRPGNDPYVIHDTRVPDGPQTIDADREPFGPAPKSWRMVLSGPGVLVVDARATAIQAAAGGLASVEIRRDGTAMTRIEDLASPAPPLEAGQAMPTPPSAATAAATTLGRKLRAFVPLALGAHVYEIDLTGAGLVRADARHRFTRLRELFTEHLPHEVARARAGIAQLPASNQRTLAEALIASALGTTPPADKAFAHSAVAIYVQLVAAPGRLTVDRARVLVREVAKLVGDRKHLDGRDLCPAVSAAEGRCGSIDGRDPCPAVSAAEGRCGSIDGRDLSIDDDLRLAIVLELCDHLPDGVDAGPLAAALLDAGRRVPSAAVLSALAPRLLGGARSDALAAAELAWREHPAVVALRTSLLAVARRTALRRVDPIPPREPTPALAPARWLTTATSTDTAELRPRLASATSTIVEVAPGRELGIDIAPHPDEPARLGVVRINVVTPPDAPGPIEIVLDGVVHRRVALEPVDVAALAAAPGHHVIRVGAPAKSRVFVAIPGPPGPNAIPAAGAARAEIRQLWPVDRAIVYTLPAPRAIGPIRIELLGFPATPAKPHVVWLHPDVGAARRFVLDVRSPDPTSWPLDDERVPAPPAAISVWLPPSTRTFSLSTDDGPIYAHLAVRAAAPSPVTPPSHAPVASGSDPATAPPTPAFGLAYIAQLSGEIAQAPDRAAGYITRAAALLELGEVGSARRDLAAAAPLLHDDDRAAYADTLAAFDTLAEPTYLPVQPPDGPIRSTVDVGPPPIPPEPALVELARRVRRDGTAASWQAIDRGDLAIPESAGGDAMRSAIAHRVNQPRAAADGWLRIDSWQARAAALGEFRTLLEAGTASVAPLAFAVASELDEVATPAVERARAAAARASRWQRVHDTEDSAGFESLSTVPGPLDQAPSIALRRALLAAPWPELPALLEPGTSTTLAIDGPRTVAVDVWCRRLWPAAGPADCALTSTLDQAAPTPLSVAHAQAGAATTVHVPAGHHELEISLAAADPTAVAAVRFADVDKTRVDREIAAVRPARVFLASTAHPAEIVVAGSPAVGIEVRGYAGHAGTADITIIGPTGEQHVALVVDPAAAATTRTGPGRDVAVTYPVERTLRLQTTGSYKIQVRPDHDVIAVRFATRVATHSGPELDAARASDVTGDGLPWPALPPSPILEARAESMSHWIPSVEAVFGQDNLTELDSEFAPLNLRFELGVEVRYRTRDFTWFTEVRARHNGPFGPTSRIRIASEIRRLPLGIGASIDLHAAIQPTPEGVVWLTRAIGEVDRPIPLNPRFQLLPELDYYAAAFSAADPPVGADPMVASVYRRDHPLQLAEHFGIRGRPFADQFMDLRFDARSNDSIASIDMIGATALWRGLVETSPRHGVVIMLEYNPTLRFANDHRAFTFWRHDIAAEIGYPFRLQRGRLVVTVRGDLYPPSNVSQTAHALALSVRWDDWSSGERNRMPSEEPLGDYVDEVPWAGLH